MITVGLVVEGPHDVITLSAFLRAEIARFTDEPLKFRPLQPVPDETGQYSGGGWVRVVAWCRTNSSAALSTYFTPLFAGDTPCDLIVIHLDGDAAELVVPHTTVSLPATPLEGASRVGFLSSALEEWLQPAPEHRARMAFAIPVLQTEAWVLIAEGVVQDCETINSKDVFRSTHARGKLADYYDRRAHLAAKRIDDIAEASASYACFRVEVAHCMP